MNEKLTESVPRRDSENLFVNFTKEHSAIHTVTNLKGVTTWDSTILK